MEFGFSEEQEDGYLLNGSKLFNAGWLCTHIFAMAKTDWKITPGHKGITNFLVDLTSPGVTVTPDLTHGGAKRSEVALEDVKVPKDAIIGKKGGACL
ncbi:MAG: hypothetical protein V2J25_01655 [Desulfatiglans sp.]|jgi:alkylation response protein AidB-like acyl-CoA dehydrogenase|nr:hypothetical protein [Desulfatiglans sp.]